MAFTIGSGTFTNGSATVTNVSLSSGTLAYFASGTRMVVGTNPVVQEVEAIAAPTVTTITLRNPWSGTGGTYDFLANQTSEGLRDAVQSIRTANSTLQDFIDSISTTATADSVVKRDASGNIETADKIIHSGDTNTAVRFPAADTVTVETNGVERLRVSSAGNIGIKNPPSNWDNSIVSALDVGSTSSFGSYGSGGDYAFMSSNWYFNGGDKYKGGFQASRYEQIDGRHVWFTAPTGTADAAITFTEVMRIDSSGNVGIGTSSPNAKLHVATTDSFSFDPISDAGVILGAQGTGSSLIVNTPSLNTFYSSGLAIDGSYDSGAFKSTVNIKAFGVCSGGPYHSEMAFYTSSAKTLLERMRIDSSGNVLAGSDNTQALGGASKRWSVVYVGTGIINTSDAREKTPVSELTADELNAAKQLSKEIGTYKFLSAVAEKGDAARNHIGMTVQRAIEIMEANNLDPFAYGFICYDEWEEQTVEHPAVEAKEAVVDDEGNIIEEAVEARDAYTEVTQEAGNRYSFRPDEMLFFIARGLDARLEALEA